MQYLAVMMLLDQVIHDLHHSRIVVTDDVTVVFNVRLILQHDMGNSPISLKEVFLLIIIQKNTQRSIGDDQRIQPTKQSKIIYRVKLTIIVLL